jgi:hypothetical protein
MNKEHEPPARGARYLDRVGAVQPKNGPIVAGAAHRGCIVVDRYEKNWGWGMSTAAATRKRRDR